jgi:hypothetical protein
VFVHRRFSSVGRQSGALPRLEERKRKDPAAPEAADELPDLQGVCRSASRHRRLGEHAFGQSRDECPASFPSFSGTRFKQLYSPNEKHWRKPSGAWTTL